MSRFKKIRSEFVVSLLVLALLGLLVYPYWMPMGLVVICIGILSVLIFGLGVFVWHESPRDEREYAITSLASRSAYLVGGAIMTVGVAVQTLQHDTDYWLVLALASMILAKAVTSFKKQ